MAKKTTYSETNIQALEWKDHIRLRPGMYIGAVNIKGFLDTIKNIFSQSLSITKPDYFQFEIKERYSGKLTFQNMKGSFMDSWCTFNPNFTHSLFLTFPVLNALSSSFNIIYLDKNRIQINEQKFEKGILKKGKIENKKWDCHSVEIDFKLDEEIWTENFEWKKNYITHQIRDFAYLYKNVKFDIKYKLDGESFRNIYHFKNGLKDRVDIEKFNGWNENYFISHTEKQFDNFSLELAFTIRDSSIDPFLLKSYVNDFHTWQDGTHVEGILKGIMMAAKTYVQKNKLAGNYKFSKKKTKDNLIAILNLKIETPHYGGPTKGLLENTEIIKPISNHVSELFLKQLEDDEKLAQRYLWQFKVQDDSY